jgi:hypothetical protein
MKEPSSELHQQNKRNLVRSILRLCGAILATEIAALALGFAFFLIVHGLIIGVIKLARYWRPAFIVFTSITGAIDTPPAFTRFPIGPCTAINLILWGVTALASIGLGIWMLLSSGFCAQSLICTATSR